ncbi:Nif3-like dinuclear metal center hexameric protein [Balneatrix alpica]|uniref:Nif3-like dinuclear metal center hexameric protein n=1 Tax=Balneatrix alpica TaxID=75684 RepID=UPI00273940B2|nr:Nif3-like dinuclear metal center hexameric protein [Balneatrix alpica]
MSEVLTIQTVVAQADAWLEPQAFKDYCPNGLQVEGGRSVRVLVSGVTASLALIEAALQRGADAILVHHGYFWRNEPYPIVGMKKQRLQRLLQADVSLLAYHLPLDAHPEFGNNQGLAAAMGWQVTGGMEPGNPRSIGLQGYLPEPRTAVQLAQQLAQVLGHPPLHVGRGPQQIKRIAWCTGAAQGMLEQAAALGVDAFVSGEISEPSVHIANELGIHYFAAGHHATERFGVQALGQRLADHFSLEHHFIDLPVPV